MKKEKHAFFRKLAAITLAVTMTIPSGITAFAKATEAKETDIAEIKAGAKISITNNTGFADDGTAVTKDKIVLTGVTATEIDQIVIGGTAVSVTDSDATKPIEVVNTTFGATAGTVDIEFKKSGAVVKPAGAPAEADGKVSCAYNAEGTSKDPIAAEIVPTNTLGKPFTIKVTTKETKTKVVIKQGSDTPVSQVVDSAGEYTFTVNPDGPFVTDAGGATEFKVTFQEPGSAISKEVTKSVTAFKKTKIDDYKANFTVTNNANGVLDTVTLTTGVTAGMIVNVYDEAGVNVLGTSAKGAAGRPLVTSLVLPPDGDINVSVTKANEVESDTVLLAVDHTQVSKNINPLTTVVLNNVGTAKDKITFKGLETEDHTAAAIPVGTTIKVYSNGTLLASTTTKAVSAAGTDFGIDLPAGKLFVAGGTLQVVVSEKDKIDGEMVDVDYDAESSTGSSLSASQVSLAYYASPAKSTVKVTNVAATDTIYVYDSSIATVPVIKGVVAASKTEITLSPVLTGGSAFVSLAKAGKAESARVEITQDLPSTPAVAASAVTVANNVIDDDVITVKGLGPKTTVYVYKNTAAATATPVMELIDAIGITEDSGTNLTLTMTIEDNTIIKEVSPATSPVTYQDRYIAVQREGYELSPFTKLTIKAEAATVKPAKATVTPGPLSNGQYTTFTVSGIGAKDRIRVYRDLTTAEQKALALADRADGDYKQDETFENLYSNGTVGTLGNNATYPVGGATALYVTLQSPNKKAVLLADLKLESGATANQAGPISAMTVTNTTGPNDKVLIPATQKLPLGTVVQLYFAASSDITKDVAPGFVAEYTTKKANEAVTFNVDLPSFPSVTPITTKGKVFAKVKTPGKDLSTAFGADYDRAYDIASTATVKFVKMGTNGGTDKVQVSVKPSTEVKVSAVPGVSSTLDSKIKIAPKTIPTGMADPDTTKPGNMLFNIEYPAGTFKRVKLGIGDYVHVKVKAPGMDWSDVSSTVIDSAATATPKEVLTSSTVVATNKIGVANDTIQVKDLDVKLVGSTIRIYSDGVLKFTKPLAKISGKAAIVESKVGFLKAAGGSVYATIQQPLMAESDQVKIDYTVEGTQSSAIADTSVAVSATVREFTVSGLSDGDKVIVYKTQYGTELLTPAKTATAATLKFTNVTAMVDPASTLVGGEFWISRISKDKTESTRTLKKYANTAAAGYAKTDALAASSVVVNDNPGTKDSLTILKTGNATIVKGAEINLYAAEITTAGVTADAGANPPIVGVTEVVSTTIAPMNRTIVVTDAMVRAATGTTFTLPTDLTTGMSAANGYYLYLTVKLPNKAESDQVKFTRFGVAVGLDKSKFTDITSVKTVYTGKVDVTINKGILANKVYKLEVVESNAVKGTAYSKLVAAEPAANVKVSIPVDANVPAGTTVSVRATEVNPTTKAAIGYATVINNAVDYGTTVFPAITAAGVDNFGTTNDTITVTATTAVNYDRVIKFYKYVGPTAPATAALAATEEVRLPKNATTAVLKVVSNPFAVTGATADFYMTVTDPGCIESKQFITANVTGYPADAKFSVTKVTDPTPNPSTTPSIAAASIYKSADGKVFVISGLTADLEYKLYAGNNYVAKATAVAGKLTVFQNVPTAATYSITVKEADPKQESAKFTLPTAAPVVATVGTR